MTGEKKDSENIGTMKPTKGGHFAQFSIGNGQRKGTTIPSSVCKTEVEANERRRRIARMISKLREGGYNSVIANMVEDAGPLDVAKFRDLEHLVDRIIKGKE